MAIRALSLSCVALLLGCAQRQPATVTFEQLAPATGSIAAIGGSAVDDRRDNFVGDRVQTSGFLHESRNGYRLYADKAAAANDERDAPSLMVINPERGGWPPLFSFACFETEVHIVGRFVADKDYGLGFARVDALRSVETGEECV